MNMKKIVNNKLAQKYKELFYRFSILPNFEKMVKVARKDFGIDEKDFGTSLKTLEKRHFKYEDFQSTVLKILRAVMPKYMRPEINFLGAATESYIIGGNKFFNDYINNGFDSYGVNIFGIDLPNLSSEYLSKFEDRYKDGIFIYLPPYASKNDLIYIINKKWPEIKKVIQEKNQNDNNFKKLIRLRSHSNKERDELIFNLYNKSRQELGFKPGQRGQYKEIRIASILIKNGLKVEPENVKMIAIRQKKLRKSNI